MEDNSNKPSSGIATLEKLLSKAILVSDTSVLRALRYSMLMSLPLLLVSACAILINNFPLEAYQSYMLTTFGPHWKDPGGAVWMATLGIFALVITITLSYCLISAHNGKKPAEYIEPASGVLTVLACFLILVAPKDMDGGLVFQWVGVNGLFGSMVITFAATSLFKWVYSIRALQLKLFSDGSDPMLPNILASLFPSFCTIGVFLFIRFFLLYLGIGNINQEIYDILRSPFEHAQQSFGLGAAYIFFVQACWFIGMHGANILSPITHDIFAIGTELNSTAVNFGETPPLIITKSLFDIYVFMGGTGTTLALIIALLLRSKDLSARRIALFSLAPGIFNINELLLFGLPIVFNVVYIIPFILVPLILLVVSYIAITLGLAPQPVYATDWTTPPVISAFVATGSWRGSCLQLVNLIIATAIYFPFVILADKAKFATRNRALSFFKEAVKGEVKGPSGKYCIDREGDIGALGRALAIELTNELETESRNIEVRYSPVINVISKEVAGAKAIPVWNHPEYGPLDAVILRSIASDISALEKLDEYIFVSVLQAQRHWLQNGINGIRLYHSISKDTLKSTDYLEKLERLLVQYTIPDGLFSVVLHEKIALDPRGKYAANIRAIHNAGVPITVSGFGKGYQAFFLLEKLPISELQLDPSLIDNIAANPSFQDIVGAIQEHCRPLHIQTSAHGVYTQSQLETLLELDFRLIEGPLYSPPLPAREFQKYVVNYSRKQLSIQGADEVVSISSRA